MKDVTRAQAEAEVLEKVKQETPTDTVPDERTCREGEVATKQPSSLVSEKLTKLVGQTQCRVVPELVKHQQHSERDDDTSLSNVSTAAETPSTKPSPETARNKKKRKNKKRSSEHRKNALESKEETKQPFRRKLPPLPKNDINVIIRSKRGLTVQDFTNHQVARAIAAASGNSETCKDEDLDEDTTWGAHGSSGGVFRKHEGRRHHLRSSWRIFQSERKGSRSYKPEC
ncbi:hypothetical protein MTO96_033905 [Rhipicephalus appendiculatus]